MKSPQLLRLCSTTSHVTMRTAAMARSVQWRLLNPKMSNTVCSPPHPTTERMLYALWHLSYSITQLMSCSHSHPCFPSKKKKGKKVKEGINWHYGWQYLASALIKQQGDLSFSPQRPRIAELAVYTALSLSRSLAFSVIQTHTHTHTYAHWPSQHGHHWVMMSHYRDGALRPPRVFMDHSLAESYSLMPSSCPSVCLSVRHSGPLVCLFRSLFSVFHTPIHPRHPCLCLFK